MMAADVLSWNRLDAFAALVEELDLHGLHFQHVALCARRAWLHLRRIDYAHLDQGMAMGELLHGLSHMRDRSTDGLAGLAPDRIDWEAGVVFEAKGGAGAVDAVSDQTAFYAVMLTAATGREWQAATHLLRQKRNRLVPIGPERLNRLWRSALQLRGLHDAEASAPAARRIPLCASCSYRHLCWS